MVKDIKTTKMKIQLLALSAFFMSLMMHAQQKDSTIVFKKKVLESTEVDFISSYYAQDGSHSAVSGGIGSEKLTDIASNIVIAIPLNTDDVLTVDAGLSAYTSASSSNINPFNKTGASGAGGDDDRLDNNNGTTTPIGTPWQASSGASKSDQLISLSASYSHSTDNRNFIWNVDASVSSEYDYSSTGFGAGVTRLFNNKNSEISVKANAYLDNWRPIYATELSEYGKYGSGFYVNGYFNGITVYNQNGVATTAYLPSKFKVWDSTGRNSFASMFSFSQVVTKNLQFSIFFDILKQEGMLSTPYQRIYFADKANFYIGNKSFIPVYESSSNTGVYRLADDIERLPNTRFKLPMGMRLNYYINEKFIFKTYYRYYQDDWDIKAHTFSAELPIKLTDAFTIYPMYRFYTQNQSKYFAPFEKHLSTETYYTSDYDLSTFQANQYGIGFDYTDLFASTKIFGLGIKNIDFRFNHYSRNDGLTANIATIAFKFTTD